MIKIFKHMSFCLEGSFTMADTTDMQRLVRSNGGKVLKHVTPLTDFLVAGMDADMERLSSAKQMEVNIITEEWFLQMCGVYRQMKNREARPVQMDMDEPARLDVMLSFDASVTRYAPNGEYLEHLRVRVDKIRDYCYIYRLPNGLIDIYTQTHGVMMPVYYSVPEGFLTIRLMRSLSQAYDNIESIETEYIARIRNWRDGYDDIVFGLHEEFLCSVRGITIPESLPKVGYAPFCKNRGIPLRPICPIPGMKIVLAS